MNIAYVSATIDAGIDAVWSVLGDFHAIDDWVGRIRSAEPPAEGPGKGTVTAGARFIRHSAIVRASLTAAREASLDSLALDSRPRAVVAAVDRDLPVDSRARAISMGLMRSKGFKTPNADS